MPPHRLAWLVALCVLGIGLAWADHAWGHRRTHGPLWQDLRHEGKTQTSPDFLARLVAEQPSEAASRQFRQFVSQAGPGKVALSSSDNLLKFINVCLTGPERPAAFFEMAYQAEAHGRIDLAMKVYTLVASLYPNTPMADRARLKRFTLEFYLDLGGGADPWLAFKTFLEKLSGLSAKFSREELREPLVAGWTAMEQTVNNRPPCLGSLQGPVRPKPRCFWGGFSRTMVFLKKQATFFPGPGTKAPARSAPRPWSSFCNWSGSPRVCRAS
jgi:hypothetical protein